MEGQGRRKWGGWGKGLGSGGRGGRADKRIVSLEGSGCGLLRVELINIYLILKYKHIFFIFRQIHLTIYTNTFDNSYKYI